MFLIRPKNSIFDIAVFRDGLCAPYVGGRTTSARLSLASRLHKDIFWMYFALCGQKLLDSHSQLQSNPTVKPWSDTFGFQITFYIYRVPKEYF